LLEAHHETRDRAGANGNVQADFRVVVPLLAGHDADALAGSRIFNPLQLTL
jgi:hypothetical protein